MAHTRHGHHASHLAKKARYELEKIGERPELIDWYCRVLDEFSLLSHWGTSAEVEIPILKDLLEEKPLSPLTDDPSEWVYHTEEVFGIPLGIWQNKRDSRAFSDDNRKTYFYFEDEHGVTKHSEPTEIKKMTNQEGN